MPKLFDKWDVLDDLIKIFGEKRVLESIGHFLSDEEVDNLYKFICSNHDESSRSTRH